MRDTFPGYDGLELAVLRRYVAGSADEAERRRVEAWAAEKVDRRRYLAAMRQLYERSPAEARDETAAMWTRIIARMDPPAGQSVDMETYVAPWEHPAVHVDVRRRTPRILGGAFVPRRRWPVWLAAAAVLAVVLGSGLLVQQQPRRHAASAGLAVGMRQIVTAKGQRAELQLSDGSRVVLGVASRLRFPATFGAGARDLYLEGTAYFDVVHDTARPFLVHTANAITEDVGTQFIITAYPESRSTQVVVSGGAVAFKARSPDAPGVVLTAGHLGQLAPADATPRVRAVDPALYGAWMHGELALRDAPLTDVVTELGRWYDGDVRLGDPSLATVPLTASFTAESFREAIAVITTVAPVRAVWQDRTVTLYRR